MSDAQAQLDQRGDQLAQLVTQVQSTLSDTAGHLATIQNGIDSLKQQIAQGVAPAALNFATVDSALAAAQQLLVSAQNVDTTATTDADQFTPPAPAPAPAPAPDQPPPAAAVAVDPATGKPTYTHVGDNPVDPGAWPTVDDGHGANGETLYTFVNDTAGGPPTAASAEWVPYTGTFTPNQPAPTTGS